MHKRNFLQNAFNSKVINRENLVFITFHTYKKSKNETKRFFNNVYGGCFPKAGI